MKKYIRCHLVEAEPMTRGEHLKSKGLSLIPGSGSESDEGYRVVYPDGYQSWCPKAQFEESVRPVDGMTFGIAIEAMSSAKKIARAGWGEGEFVRAEEMLTFEDGMLHMNEDNKVPLMSSMCCVYHWCEKESKEPLFRAGWTPSFDDIIAVDWKIVE